MIFDACLTGSKMGFKNENSQSLCLTLMVIVLALRIQEISAQIIDSSSGSAPTGEVSNLFSYPCWSTLKLFQKVKI